MSSLPSWSKTAPTPTSVASNINLSRSPVLSPDIFCENTVINILDYVEYFMHKFTRACEIEHGNLKQSQAKMKQWYDKDTTKSRNTSLTANSGM
jgi:hypothetical protein